MKIFADSSFLIALYDSGDQYFQKAHFLLNSIKKDMPQVIISDYVYDETLTFLLTTHRYYGFIRTQAFDRDVMGKKFCDVIFIDSSLFYKAREIFNRYNKDKIWSFTDCTSFALMEDYGIRQALSFDKNFSQRGFKIVG